MTADQTELAQDIEAIERAARLEGRLPADLRAQLGAAAFRLKRVRWSIEPAERDASVLRFAYLGQRSRREFQAGSERVELPPRIGHLLLAAIQSSVGVVSRGQTPGAVRQAIGRALKRMPDDVASALATARNHGAGITVYEHPDGALVRFTPGRHPIHVSATLVPPDDPELSARLWASLLVLPPPPPGRMVRSVR